jgi:hypothetical protein
LPGGSFEPNFASILASWRFAATGFRGQEYPEGPVNHYRQGDVLLIRVDGLFATKGRKVSREDGRVVLAHGEATGHAHAIEAEHADLYEAADGKRLLEVLGEPVTLDHEEHGTLTLDPGVYEVRRQREYIPQAPPRRVRD